MNDTDKKKFAFLGYKEIASPPWAAIKAALKMNLNKFTENVDMDNAVILCGQEAYSLECTEDQMRTEARKFLEENFQLHDVYMADTQFIKSIDTSKTEMVEGYKSVIAHCKKCPVFDIPLYLHAGCKNLTEGSLSKIIVAVPDHLVPKEIGKQTPFTDIKLGGKPSLATSIAYVHELMHALLESKPGYTNNLVYKETIPVFTECVFADSLHEEKLKDYTRIRTTYEFMLLLEGYEAKRVEEDEALHALGGLMGVKLYEKFANERKEKNKKEYLSNIQKMIDGEMTVEELLMKKGVTINSAIDASFIERHL